MRAEGPPFGSGSLGAAARPIAGCTPARYRVRGVTQITVGAGVHPAMLAEGPPFGSESLGPLRSPSRAYARSLQGRWRYADHCRSQGAAGDAGRRTAVWLRIVGAAARPIAGCTPAPTKESARQALASNHRISNQSAPRGDPVGAGEACEEAGPDTPRHSPHPLVAAP